MTRLLLNPILRLGLQRCGRDRNLDWPTPAAGPTLAPGNPLSGKSARTIAVNTGQKSIVRSAAVLSLHDYDATDRLPVSRDGNSHTLPDGMKITGLPAELKRHTPNSPSTKEAGIGIPIRNVHRGLRLRLVRRAG